MIPTRKLRGLPVLVILLLTANSLPAAPAPSVLTWEADTAGSQSLVLTPATGEGIVEVRTEGGIRGITVLPRSRAAFAYFKVGGAGLRGGNWPAFLLSIRYFAGPGPAPVIEYDSSDPTPHPGAFRPLSLEGDSPGWNTREFLITDAGFSGRTNGHDLRISFPADARSIVASIRLVPMMLPIAPKVQDRIVPGQPSAVETVVAALTGPDLGLPLASGADNALLLQYGLDLVARAGGGTFYLPAGRYALQKPIRVPTGVTLRGEWGVPGQGKPVAGTVLEIRHGHDKPDGLPAVALDQGSGLLDLAFWYPEQDASAIRPYPYTIAQAGFDGATAERITLVNSFHGIRIGPGGTELHTLKDIFGSPLDTGLEIWSVSDIGRLEGIHFDPDFWSDSGLPGSPRRGGPHARYVLAHATGIRLFRSDWQYAAYGSLRGYAIGLDLAAGPGGAGGNGQFFDWAVTGGAVALRVEEAAGPGWLFTRCTFEGSEAALRTEATFHSNLLFESTRFGGRVESRGSSSSRSAFMRCTFDGPAEFLSGVLAVTAPQFGSLGTFHLGAGVAAAQLLGSFPSEMRLPPADPRIRVDPAVPASLGAGPEPLARPVHVLRKPARLTTVMPSGSGDDAPAIQAALDASKAGGMVYLPGSSYTLGSSVTIPPMVELRGSSAVPHHTLGRGTRLNVMYGGKDPDGTPAVVLREKSTLRGLTFAYPDQSVDDPVPYPPTVQGRGPDIEVIDVTAVNPWLFLDLSSWRCDRHYVSGVGGAPLRTGIRLGSGSTGGVIADSQFNTHYWVRDPILGGASVNAKLWSFQLGSLDAFVLGSSRDHTFFQNFAFGTRRGLVFVGNGGEGYQGRNWGTGIDGTMTSLAVESTGPGETVLVNGQWVANASPQAEYIVLSPGLTGSVRLINNLFWGDPVRSLTQESGTLKLENAVFLTYGPQVLRGGRILGTHVLWVQSRGDHEIEDRGGSHQFWGSMAPLGLRSFPAAPAGAAAGVLALQVPVPAGARSLRVDLGERKVPFGLDMIESNGETDFRPAEQAGKWAWASVLALTDKRNLWFDYTVVLPDDWRNGRTTDMTVIVEYLDVPSSTLRLVYDSDAGPWKEAGTFRTAGTMTWKTWRVSLRGVSFQGRLNGADLRWEIVGPDPLPLSRIELTRP